MLGTAGLSVHAANKPPAITIFAPATIAFAISPLHLIPPSAIIGIFFSEPSKKSPEYKPEHFCVQLNIGIVNPVLSLVVHGEPCPIPTFTTSAPQSDKSLTA